MKYEEFNEPGILILLRARYTAALVYGHYYLKYGDQIFFKVSDKRPIEYGPMSTNVKQHFALINRPCLTRYFKPSEISWFMGDGNNQIGLLNNKNMLWMMNMRLENEALGILNLQINSLGTPHEFFYPHLKNFYDEIHFDGSGV